MLPSERIALHLRAAQEFGAALDELIPLLRPAYVRYRAPSWRPNGTDDARAAELVDAGHRLAGPAAEAFSEVSMSLAYTPPAATRQPTRIINPAQNWDTIFDDTPMFTPQELRGYVGQVEGALQGQYDRARRRERGVVGWLARFVLLPQRVRDAAGLTKDSAGGRFAFGVGIFVQLLVALVAGTGATILGSLALRLFGWE